MTPLIVTLVVFFGACVAIPAIAILGPKIVRPIQTVPGFGTRMRDSPYAPADVSDFLHHFVVCVWKYNVGPKPPLQGRLITIVDNLNIYWQHEPVRVVLDPVANVVGKRMGLTTRKDTVEVVATPSIRDSALAHELCHVLLWNLTGDGDANHLGGRGGWSKAHDDLIDEMRLK